MQQQLEDRKKRKNPGSGSWNGGQSQKKHCKLICIGANEKRYFSRPERYESRLCYLIYIFTSNPLVDQ
jgi:hypothetical protein